MYQVSLEGSDLVESYTILKYNKTILRRIYNKGVREGEDTRKIFKNYYKKKFRAYRTVHNFFDTVPSLQGDIIFIDDNIDDECLKEPLSQKLEVNDIVPDINDTAFSSVKVKLEFHVGYINSKFIDNDVCNNLDVDMIHIPQKLKKNCKLLIKKYYAYDFGKFVPRLSKDMQKGLSTWIIWCDLCQKEKCINLGKSFNLSNFEIHLQPKLPLKRGISISKSKHVMSFLQKKND